MPIILYAEDDEGIRKTTLELLEIEGYEVLVASNGQEALELYSPNAERVDLLLTDLRMPKMNGRELAEQIRQKNPNLPIIIFACFSSPEQEEELRQAGFITVCKPDKYEELFVAIKEATK